MLGEMSCEMPERKPSKPPPPTACPTPGPPGLSSLLLMEPLIHSPFWRAKMRNLLTHVTAKSRDYMASGMAGSRSSRIVIRTGFLSVFGFAVLCAGRLSPCGSHPCLRGLLSQWFLKHLRLESYWPGLGHMPPLAPRIRSESHPKQGIRVLLVQ